MVALNHFTGAGIFGLGANDVIQHLLRAGSALTVWTISSEFQFYGLFIAIWFLRSRVSSPYLILLPLLVFSVVAMQWLGTSAGRNAILGYLHIFVSGLLIASLTAKEPAGWDRTAGWMVIVLGLAYATAFLVVPRVYEARWIYTDLLIVLLCDGLLLATILGRDCFANRLLSYPIFQWLGEVSFGIYLLHRPAAWMVDLAMGEMSKWVSLPFKVALTFLFAQIAFVFLEGPSRSFIRRVFTKSSAQAKPSESS